MKMNSLKVLYRTTLSITLLFAASNLFTVFALTAQRPTDEEKRLQVKIDEKKQNFQNDLELTLGKPIERQLAGSQVHSYKIVLAASQYLHVVVDQRGIDVVVTLFAPGGKKVAEVDGFNGAHGPEPISMVAEEAGSYRLEISSNEADAKTGLYQVVIEEIRKSKPQDKILIAAQQAFFEGLEFDAEGSADSLHKAIDKYEEALQLFRAIDDKVREVDVLNSIGYAYAYLGEKQKALSFYNQALLLSPAVSDLGSKAETLNNIGYAYAHLGEKQKALDFYNQALPLRHAVGDRFGEAKTLTNIGFIYSSIGEKQKALDFFNQALPLRRAVRNRDGEAVTLDNIGAVYASLGEWQKALDFYNKSLLLFRAVGERLGEASSLHNIGYVYALLGKRQKALAFYNQALLLRRMVGDRKGEAETLTSIGFVYYSQDEKQKASDFFNQSLSLSRAVGNIESEANTLYGIAVVARDQGNLEDSIAKIEAALVIIESIRTKITSQELRSSYFATVQDYYNFYIDTLMRLHKQQPKAGYDAKAIQASERARARSLFETLTEANADIRQGVDPILLERERSVQQLLAGKSERLTRISNDEKLKAQKPAAEKEVNELLAQYQDIEAQIRVKSPRYAALTQPVPSNLTEIQQLLDKNTVLLEYSLGEERSYLWLVTPQSLKSYELPKRAQIEESANRVISAITVRNNAPGNNAAERQKWLARIKLADASYPKFAAELSKMLLGQIASEIEGKRLIIVGDGALQYVPFAALPKPVQPNGAASAGAPLVASNEIVNLPSASVLTILRREETARLDRKSYAKTVAVFADPVFDSDDKRVFANAKNSRTESKTALTSGQVQKPDGNTPAADVQSTLSRSVKEVGLANRGGLRRLLNSKDEAAAIRDAAANGQTTMALGFDASRERVMANNLAEYRIVHFATHGLLNEENPELSGVVLSLVDEHGKPQNGFLRLHEIFNLNLPVEMVVLSACQTGLGKKIKGEGLVGLTRGFMYAGAPRVVASLWSVDDRATSVLMSIFYRKMLREGLAPAAALREAQNEVRGQKEWRLPVFWAGFVLQGEWRNIAPNKK